MLDDIVIDKTENYLSYDKKDKFIEIINQIYQITKQLNDVYPNYKEWYWNKLVKGCYNRTRNIIFVKNNLGEIIALSCLKKDREEKKICTLFVDSNYRMLGIGNMLLEESMKYLETTKPLVTFSEDKKEMFSKIIEKYDWKLTEIIDGIYSNNVKELCFNGALLKEDNTTLNK